MKHVYGTLIDISKADVFTMKNEHSYAAFIGVLSNIYMKAHASSPYREQPYTAALIINRSMLRSYKNESESSLDRIKAILSRMIEPAGGIILGIYVVKNEMFSRNSKIGLKHTVSQCWPLKNNGVAKIITGNTPPNNLSKGENIVRYFSKQQITPYVDKFIDYSTSIENVFETLEKSKTHICYQGGTAWLSVAMNIPTIIVHPKNIPNSPHHKSRLFGQDLGNINIIEAGKITHVRQHPHEHHVVLKNIKQQIDNLS